MEKHIVTALEEFQRKLNEPPPQNEIQRNDAAGGSLYLPISYVQMTLDELYFGQWESYLDYIQVIANEVIGFGRLVVTHPVTGQKITRAGAAAVMIQMKSESNGGTGKISDVDNKIKNTLVKDFPHLKAEVEKSAAKTLGKRFGRDLNRKHVDTYNPYSIEEGSAEPIRNKLQDMIDNNVLPAALHTFVAAQLPTATFAQLVLMQEKADKAITQQINGADNAVIN